MTPGRTATQCAAATLQANRVPRDAGDEHDDDKNQSGTRRGANADVAAQKDCAGGWTIAIDSTAAGRVGGLFRLPQSTQESNMRSAPRRRRRGASRTSVLRVPDQGVDVGLGLPGSPAEVGVERPRPELGAAIRQRHVLLAESAGAYPARPISIPWLSTR